MAAATPLWWGTVLLFACVGSGHAPALAGAPDHTPLYTAASGAVVTSPAPAEGVARIPIPMNPQVWGALRVLLTDRAPSLADAFSRARRFGGHLREIVRQAGLPDDILGLAFLESGMNPHATSVAQAAGLWQFLESTARRYGLRTTPWVDERRDPEKSTRAAAAYLRDLHRRFPSWPLALAAYHAGESAIQRAVLYRHTRDLWRLGLPEKTERLVATYLAMMLIGREPELYGFRPPTDAPVETALLDVLGSTPLSTVARAVAVDVESLQDLNPELVRSITPPDRPYRLRIPRLHEPEPTRHPGGDTVARPPDLRK